MFTKARIIIIVIAVGLVAGFLFWKFAPSFNSQQVKKGPVVINIYGLWEQESLIRPAIDKYKKDHPEVEIKYNYQSSNNYRTRIQTQLDEGGGPDIFMIHNSWLPMFLKGRYLSETPASVMTVEEYKRVFYPVVADSFIKDNKIYAVARGIDGLALYINEGLLKNVGAEIPRNWDEFRDTATKVTVIDSNGKIITAGAAMGTTTNVDHWPDILGLLMVQQFSLVPGAKLEKIDRREGAEILKFYTDFVKDPRRKVWDSTMESSTQAFAAGRLAMYFGPSWQAHELRVANPQLQFRVVPVPHLNGTNANWATFWGYAVSSKSQNQKEAWEFLKYLTSSESQKLLYQEAAKARLFGLPYSRVELQKEIASDPIVGAFVAQGAGYKYWYLSSKTFDKGINDEIIKAFEEGVNSITVNGQSPELALTSIQPKVQQSLEKFGVLQPPPSPQGR